ADSPKTPNQFSGNSSWYGVPFHGKKTASGEIFDMNKLSAAHKTLPLPTKLMVENPKTGKTAIIKVNDRGPYVKTRVVDCSREAAKTLGYIDHGTAYLEFTVLPKADKANQAKSEAKGADKVQAKK